MLFFFFLDKCNVLFQKLPRIDSARISQLLCFSRLAFHGGLSAQSFQPIKDHLVHDHWCVSYRLEGSGLNCNM